MLHEILLSLSGHPSPLLTADHSSPSSILSPSEKALLASVAHLSDLHRTLLAHTASVAASHPSTICQAVATAIRGTHLAAFQRTVLDVEEGILRKDAGSVGAYNIVPLTAVVGRFSGWTRRLEWFLEMVEFMVRRGEGGRRCSGAMIVDWLCESLQTGYVDVEEAALGLVRVAETAWLRQVSGWVLYGRLPGVGREDFFVRAVDEDVEEYELKTELLPAFVSPKTAGSLLFIGRSLNHIRVRGLSSSTSPELNLVSSNLKQLSALQFPISGANFSRAITSIRLALSQTTLQKLLPTSKVVEILSLLRQFFLLGRGEFAIALIAESDAKIRSRWQRSNGLAYEKRDGLGNVVMKDGEVSAVLARTWAAMGLLQSRDTDQDEDEILELARDLVQLVITKSSSVTPSKSSPNPSQAAQVAQVASAPFKNLLLSVPVVLTMHIPSPLDLFLTPSDIQIYSSINAYFFSIRRAHLRLTDLWKITSLRRDHPAPPGPPYSSSGAGRNKVKTLRQRANERSRVMRSVWATSSAAVFFLGETEAYLQGEVVEETWNEFRNWLTAEGKADSDLDPAQTAAEHEDDDTDDEDIWVKAGREPTPTTKMNPTQDPQSLSDAHRRYLAALTDSLLLTTPSFTGPLFHLLQQIEHLVALIHRVHSIWQSLDLEADEGVVDAFSDFHKEEAEVRVQLLVISGRVKAAVGELVKGLREVDREKEGWDTGLEELVLGEEGQYVAKRVGRVDRLLMKLDFGGWFDGGENQGSSDGGSEGDDGL